jgi:hypothetical protein
MTAVEITIGTTVVGAVHTTHNSADVPFWAAYAYRAPLSDVALGSFSTPEGARLAMLANRGYAQGAA